MEINALCYVVLLLVIWAGLAYLLFNNKNKSKVMFANCKGPFTPKVK